MNRTREGYCCVPNPFNLKQITYVSLKPKDVVAIVFWTRNAGPLLPYVGELKERGYCFYFQYTVMNNPRSLDPAQSPLGKRIETFKRLSDAVGSEAIIWRYDPIVLTSASPVEFHLEQHARIAEQLKGYTRRNVISIVDLYKSGERRMRQSERQNDITFYECDDDALRALVPSLVRQAHDCGMEIVSCAEKIDLSPYGVAPGKCIDPELIYRLSGKPVSYKKDRDQRRECLCHDSVDIGMYDTCVFGCVYCYATHSFETARKRRLEHDPNSPSLIGRYDCMQPNEQQLRLEELDHG